MLKIPAGGSARAHGGRDPAAARETSSAFPAESFGAEGRGRVKFWAETSVFNFSISC